jgi:hypothetical protein
MEAWMTKAIRMLLSLTAMLAAGCTDAAVSSPRVSAPDSPHLKRGNGHEKLDSNGDTLQISFTIDPSTTSQTSFGAGNTVTFPAHSLCDPYKSSYGLGEWDRPCPIATKPLTITAKAWMDHGHPRVDFTPDVRFVPTADPSGFVVMTFTDDAAAKLSDALIVYCRQAKGKGSCIDESKQDPSVRTYTDPATGQLTRRVKHFSGYSITTGDEGRMDGAMDRFVRGGLQIQP